MTDSHWNYCLEVLPRVSRTFAINIGVLRGNLHRSTLLGYLLCRILDTVEDSPSLEPEIKIRALKKFPSVLEGRNWENLLQDWLREVESGNFDGEPAEIELVENTFSVITCVKKLPRNYQAPTETLVSTMANGMARFIERFPDGNIFLQDEEDLRDYCYHVAGVVGEFFHRIFRITCPVDADKAPILKECRIDFGLGLQMTNIAKDIFKDAKRGQTFIPKSFLQKAGLTREEFLRGEKKEQILLARRMLLRTAHAHLQRAFHFFIEGIPRRHIRLRLACIWPLWMAFATLKNIHDNMGSTPWDRDCKISRGEVKKILLKTSLIIPSNGLIRRDFAHNYQQISF